MTNMRRRSVLLGLAASACASPDPRLYTLQAAPGTPRAGGPRAILLRSVSLARYLERPQIVRSSEDYQLAVEQNDWWGEPLSAMVGRILNEDLSQRLPSTQVFNESSAISPDADIRVEVNVLRMDADRNGAVVLEAQVALARRSGDPVSRGYRFTVPPSGPGISDQIAASSQAIAQLADAVAAMIA